MSTDQIAAEVVFDAFVEMEEDFRRLTRRAKVRFESRDWQGMADDASDRISLYPETATRTAEVVGEYLGNTRFDRSLWAGVRSAYSELAGDRPELELAETFYNSVTRRIFDTVGVDAAIEFVDSEAKPIDGTTSSLRVDCAEGLANAVRQAVESAGFRAPFEDLDGDLERAADRIIHLVSEPVQLEVATSVFYRGKGAYLVGQVVGTVETQPLAIAFEHGEAGINVDAVLLEENDVSVLFSFAHSYFHVDTDRPRDLVEYIRDQVPRKRLSEMYISIGRPRHGKTELYRELLDHLRTSDDLFQRPPGKEGLVMAVFHLPGFEMVFKVIKDSFPPQKKLTPSQVMDKYRLVYRHDRAGRLIDSQVYEHLEFERDRFAPGFLDHLLSACSRSVQLDGDKVAISRAYVQRRVVPLDVYLRDTTPDMAAAAVIDYGNAIRDLATTGMFPGDLLIKNFGVTRNERVVFYDYDELTELADCRFRDMPVASNIEDEMSATPWFPVGPADIFPSEFESFLGLSPELKAVFMDNHSDLLDAAWWKSIQARLRAGEIVSIYPYSDSLRLS